MIPAPPGLYARYSSDGESFLLRRVVAFNVNGVALVLHPEGVLTIAAGLPGFQSVVDTLRYGSAEPHFQAIIPGADYWAEWDELGEEPAGTPRARKCRVRVLAWALQPDGLLVALGIGPGGTVDAIGHPDAEIHYVHVEESSVSYDAGANAVYCEIRPVGAHEEITTRQFPGVNLDVVGADVVGVEVLDARGGWGPRPAPVPGPASAIVDDAGAQT